MNKYGQLCYTYLIGWKEIDRWYYGYRAANKVTPTDDLMNEYKTSSKKVKQLIGEIGNPNVVRVHKLYDTKEEAKDYETRFLLRVNAVRSERWLNQYDTHRFTGPKFHSEETKRKMRHPHSSPSKEARVRMKLGALRRAPASEETRSKISAGNKNKKRSFETCLKQQARTCSEETKMKLRKPKKILIVHIVVRLAENQRCIDGILTTVRN